MSKDKYLYNKVKLEIIEELKNMEPHTRLPSRTKLMEKFGVTRTTVERAISELIGEGYLYAKDGSGTYVQDWQTKGGDGDRKNWGVIVPNIMYDTYPGILRGIEDIANHNNMSVVICNTDDDIEKQSSYISKLIYSGVNGLIIVPAIGREQDVQSFHLIREKKVPIVFCNRVVWGVPAQAVVSNNVYGGYLATKHLIKLGCRRIAYISVPLYAVSMERYQGYVSALLESGLEVNGDYVVFEDDFQDRDKGYRSALQILNRRPRPDAIFCFSDAIAQGVYNAAQEQGLAIGKDIAIIGYNDTSAADTLRLTTVQFKSYETGNWAARLLLKQLREPHVRHQRVVVLQPELIIRKSCGGSREDEA